ncbi:MAG: PD-(D/E)XK nuclease family protein, partial [Clostridia bacterium]|nr:PD-(D/E)XK nuclease family protein [Clostridia bacterium]
MAVIEHLMQASPDVTVSLTCDQSDSHLLAFEKAAQTARDLIRLAERSGVEVIIEAVDGSHPSMQPLRDRLFQGNIVSSMAKDILQVYHGDSPWKECMAAAQMVRRLVDQGCRYRDITLVCPDMKTYQPLVDMIFHRFQIPVYRSGTEDILQRSVIGTVLTALDAAVSGFDQRETLRYLRSALSPLDPDTCDMVENYVILWGIRGSRWSEPWEYHPRGLGEPWDESAHELLRLLNGARDAVIDPLTNLRKGFQNAVDLREQVQCLYQFLEAIRLGDTLEHLAAELDAAGDNRSAQILNQLWEILMGALEQMYDVLGQTHWDMEHFSRLFRLLLSQYDVGTIPPVLDAVQMGPVSAMRCHQQKYLMLLGAQEGNLPGYTGSSGVLTDQERVTLRQLGVPLTGGAMEGIQAEFAEIYGVFCGAMEKIFVFYSGEQPSFVCRRLAAMAGGEGQAEEGMGFAVSDPYEAGLWLAGWHAEEVAQTLGITEEYRCAEEKRDFCMGKVGCENIQALYGKTLNLSASQIDRQAECRMSYFLKYGLRAKERKEITVDPAEFGTYVHAVLENTVRCIRDRGGFRSVSLEETMEIAHRYSEEYASERFSQIASERMTYLFRRNTQELDMVVRELWEELRESLFEPREFEVNFGGQGGQPAIAIANNSM